jgi:hypothetical protein
MLTFLVLSSLAAMAFVMGAVGLLVGGIVWLVLFPVRLLFKLVFGVAGVLLGLLLVPILGIVAAIVAVAVLAAVAIAALVPLLPILALGFVGWALFKAVTRRTSPAI